MIRIIKRGHVLRVSLDREAKLNALTVAMWHDLARAFKEADADEDLRLVVLEGAGDRAFCVGADIAEFETSRAGKAQAMSYAKTIFAGVEAIEHCRHPTIALIRGYCVGGGLEVAAACDMRIAREGSRFGVPVRKLGLPVDYPELAALRRLVGPANALEILFEGRVFDAQEALQKGLINRILPEAEFEQECSQIIERIVTGAPLVARWHKAMVRRLDDPAPLSAEERDAPFATFDTEDYRIGTRAFLDKSEPEFVGR
ncbi:MAG: enoyl-CoA hydratase-related protein [Pseudomonadota bacterium]